MGLLSQYTTLLEKSRQMLELAQRQEWELLAASEAERAALLAKIPPRTLALGAAESSSIAATIRQIQDCDRKIFEHVTPWREHAATLLSRLAPR